MISPSSATFKWSEVPCSFRQGCVLIGPLLQSQPGLACAHKTPPKKKQNKKRGKKAGPLPASYQMLQDQKAECGPQDTGAVGWYEPGLFRPAGQGSGAHVKGYLLQRGSRNNAKLFCPFKNGKCLGRVIYYLPGCIFSLSPSRLGKYWHFCLFKRSWV